LWVRGQPIAHRGVDRARQKTTVRKPGEHAIDRMADRRPEMYAELLKPHQLKRPGRE
jgi:hypothetical protein